MAYLKLPSTLMNIYPRLLKLGCSRCISDNQLFVLRRGNDFVYLLKHVDDCLLAAPRNSKLLRTVGEDLSKVYKITTEIEPANFVGLAISRDCIKRKITLRQPHYIQIIADRFPIKPSSPAYPMTEDFLTKIAIL
jgi:hypothetical protein